METTDKVDGNPPITASECELLNPLSQTSKFSKRSAELIDGSGKHNGWLNLQSPHVIDRHSKTKLYSTQLIFRYQHTTSQMFYFFVPKQN